MKFYIPNSKIGEVDEYDCVWLNPAEFSPHREAIVLDQWGNGWIFEADESFNTFFTIITGDSLPIITDAEYAQFIMDKIAFLGKNEPRSLELPG